MIVLELIISLIIIIAFIAGTIEIVTDPCTWEALDESIESLGRNILKLIVYLLKCLKKLIFFLCKSGVKLLHQATILFGKGTVQATKGITRGGYSVAKGVSKGTCKGIGYSISAIQAANKRKREYEKQEEERKSIERYNMLQDLEAAIKEKSSGNFEAFKDRIIIAKMKYGDYNVNKVLKKIDW